VTVDEQALLRRSRLRFGAVVLRVLVVGVAGYIGFVAFAGSEQGPATGVMVLGALTGFAAFFSPCSFPLLLTFLATRSTESRGEAALSALRVGAGAAALLAVIALAVAGGGTALASVVEFDSLSGRVFRLAVGLVLILLGLRQAHLLGLRMRWIDRVARSASRIFDSSSVSDRARGDIAYGFGYLLAGFG
jgi:cytochrome c biogenesis protein CcdA